MNSGRPYDSLYDGTYRVSGARDHYREQNRNAGVVIDRVPEFSNMFSKLPHHPSTTYRFKANDHIPQHVDREYAEPKLTADQRATMASKDVVSGSERYKYFKRPLLGTASAVPAQLASHRAPQMGGGYDEDGGSTYVPQSRTVGVQSTYRESEAQTLAYTPDYVIPEDPTGKQKALMDKYHTEVPEVLTLQKLKFGEGLPVGLTELNHIDKLREKRAFEATLPPLHDIARLPQRKAMMEAWEHKEWAEREDEILEFQEERLELLAQAIETREANVETMAEDRVERLKERELAKRDQVFASIQKRRIKAVRQLTHARTKTDTTKIKKKTIVQKYGDFGSNIYAPLQREGRFPESKPAGKELDPEPFVPRTLNSLYELENSVPARKFEAKIKGPKSTKRLDAAGRKEKAVCAHLDHINVLLQDSKSQGGRGYGDCWPYPIASDAKLKKDEYHRAIVERPNTPLAPPVAEHAARDAAATLLQRLLRGRAVQNIMYEGKSKRLELINELRLQETAEQREAEMLEKARTAAKTIGRPEAAPSTLPMPGMLHVQDAVLDDLVGESVMEVLVVITMEPGEEQDNAMYELLKKYAGYSTAAASSKDEAATKIQSIFRGRQSRKDMASLKNLRGEGAQMREQIIYSAEQEAAAVKIQARTRGMLARKTKTSSTSKTSKTSKTTTTKTSTEQKATRRTTEAYSSSKSDDKKIVLIQARSRGYLARKAAQKKQQDDTALLDLTSFSQEDQDKIAKIQASGRGYIARKRVNAMRQPADVDSASDATSAPKPEAPNAEEAAADKTPAAVEEAEELPDLKAFTDAEKEQISKIQGKARLFNKKNRGEASSASSSAAGTPTAASRSTFTQFADGAQTPKSEAAASADLSEAGAAAPAGGYGADLEASKGDAAAQAAPAADADAISTPQPADAAAAAAEGEGDGDADPPAAPDASGDGADAPHALAQAADTAADFSVLSEVAAATATADGGDGASQLPTDAAAAGAEAAAADSAAAAAAANGGDGAAALVADGFSDTPTVAAVDVGDGASHPPSAAAAAVDGAAADGGDGVSHPPAAATAPVDGATADGGGGVSHPPAAADEAAAAGAAADRAAAGGGDGVSDPTATASASGATADGGDGVSELAAADGGAAADGVDGVSEPATSAAADAAGAVAATTDGSDSVSHPATAEATVSAGGGEGKGAAATRAAIDGGDGDSEPAAYAAVPAAADGPAAAAGEAVATAAGVADDLPATDAAADGPGADPTASAEATSDSAEETAAASAEVASAGETAAASAEVASAGETAAASAEVASAEVASAGETAAAEPDTGAQPAAAEAAPGSDLAPEAGGDADAAVAAEPEAVTAAESVETAAGSEVMEAAGGGDLPDLSIFSDEDQKKIVTMQAQSRGYMARKQMKEQKTESQQVTRSESTQSSSSGTATTTKMHNSASSSHVTTTESSSVVQTSSTMVHSESTSSVVQSSTVVTSSSTTVSASESTSATVESIATVVTQEKTE